MTLSRQLINLAGGLAVVVILALGILLVALPTFNQARATEQQADEIAATNDVYDIQVETLRGQQTQLGDLERELAALRAQIPATPLNDEVFELIGEAVEATGGVTVETITAADAETWLPPSADPEGTDGTAAAPDATTGAASTDATGTDATATTGTTPPADGATDPAADPNAAADGTAAETPAPVEVDPRQMVPFTLVVTLGDAAQAARFLDALRDDDRLLTIEQAVLTEEEGELRLTVNARSLVLLQK